MAVLVERTRMDMSHLLQAEANISALPSSSLQALVTPSQSLESLTHALQQGDLYYCSDYPQCPYVVYFRGSHYINPEAQTAASPSAIEKLRARYPFVTFNDHEPPASVQNGALRRQYYNAPAIAPAPSTFTNNGMFDQPESSLNKDVWFTLFFYQLDENNQKQPVEGLPYELQWGSSDDTFMSGKTPADGRLAWEGDSHHLNYRVYYGEPKEGQYPLFAYLPLNKDETIRLHWVKLTLEDETGQPIEGQDYWIETTDDVEHTGTTNAEGTAHINRIGSDDRCGIRFPDKSGILKDGKTFPPASTATAGNYTIQQGDTLTRIALENGLNSADDIYNHPANKAFKDKRPNPNVIYPGDELALPEPNSMPFAESIDKTHRFVLKPPKEMFELIIKNDEGEVWAGKRAVLTVGEQTLDQTLDENGLLSVELPLLNEKEATLEIYLDEESEEPSHTMEIQLAHLDPIDTLSGIQGRCNNLGFDCGTVDGEMGSLTQEAIKAFQEQHQLDVDGEPSQQTQDKLQQVYGF